jgi:flagellar protein FliO/FliZ
VSSLFGIEASRAVQFAIAFAIILILLVLFGVVFRKLTGARLMMPGSDRGRGSRQPRLGIVDVYDLDRQTRPAETASSSASRQRRAPSSHRWPQ